MGIVMNVSDQTQDTKNTVNTIIKSLYDEYKDTSIPDREWYKDIINTFPIKIGICIKYTDGTPDWVIFQSTRAALIVDIIEQHHINLLLGTK